MILTFAPAWARADGLRVKLYTAPSWCPPCQALERFLKAQHLLDPGARVPIEVIDIDQTPPAEGEKVSGGVPELQLYDGDRRISVHNGGFASRADWEAFVDPNRGPGPQFGKPMQILPNAAPARAAQLPREAQPAPAPAIPMPAAPVIVQSLAAAKAPSSSREMLGDTPFSKRVAIPSSAAILIGTGRGPEENPISVGLALRDARRTLSGPLRVPASGLLTMYGSGSESPEEPEAYEIPADAWPTATGQIQAKNAHVTGVMPDAPFTRPNLLGAMKALYDHRVRNLLVVLAGHGAPEGVQHWGPENGTRALDPETFHKFLQASQVQNSVIVSGNCYGGRFVHAASCGFFAARPDREAAGCSPEASLRMAPGESRDYLSLFFRSLATPGTTFAEAHWRATALGEDSDAPYSSVDALVERHFATHPSDGKLTLTRDELLGLRNYSNAAERRAYDLMITPWIASAATNGHLSLIDLLRKKETKKYQLLRRLIVRKMAGRGELAADTLAELRKLDACENQSPAAFFSSPAYVSR